MGIKDLIPWNNGGREVAISRGADVNPFFTLHREMNRMFDDVFRGFDLAPFGSARGMSGLGWPQIDIDETDKEVRITARLVKVENGEILSTFAVTHSIHDLFGAQDALANGLLPKLKELARK